MTSFALGLLIGLVCGFEAHRLHFLLEHIRKLLEPENPAGVTYGLEKPINEYPSSTAIVEPKTPQLVAWEASQELEKEQLGIKPEK